jgi:galactosamine-6-phosphate isomerase
MRIIVSKTYTELSQQAADDAARLMREFQQPLLCTASGDSPAGMYHKLVEKFNIKDLDISSWIFVGLDEWAGMNGKDEGSCRYHLNNQLFCPLGVTGDKIIFFDGRAKDLEKECENVEQFILQHGGIDLAILGLGMNGHIGMNEPGTSAASRSHVTTLDPLTQQTAQKYFSRQQELREGITLGLATLMESKNIFLLVNGGHKAGIARKMLEEDISEQLPATLLRSHPRLTVYLDKEAAKLLHPKTV